MKCYIPYWSNGYHIKEADTEHIRRPTHNKSIPYRGVVYGQNAYTTEEAAQAYIDKRYNYCKDFAIN